MQGIPIGKAFGIQLKLHWSWFIIFALITWALAANYFPLTYPTWNLTSGIAAGIVTSLLFFASVLFHELMHSAVALSEKIHIQGITLFILGGVSEMTEEPKIAIDEFRMAFAGPASSLILGGIFLGIFAALGGTVTWGSFYLGKCHDTGFEFSGGPIYRSHSFLARLHQSRPWCF